MNHLVPPVTLRAIHPWPYDFFASPSSLNRNSRGRLLTSSSRSNAPFSRKYCFNPLHVFWPILINSLKQLLPRPFNQRLPSSPRFHHHPVHIPGFYVNHYPRSLLKDSSHTSLSHVSCICVKCFIGLKWDLGLCTYSQPPPGAVRTRHRKGTGKISLAIY